MTADVLVLDGVSRNFGGVVAADNVNMRVPAGQITGLIGPNGAGKSTLINLITGLLHLSAGKVHLDGRDISREEAPAIAKAGIARTFQTVRLLKDESVLDNVAMGILAAPTTPVLARLFGLPSARAELRSAREKASALLTRFDMARFASHPAGMLSYGHQRRVEMMRAVAMKPRVLLLDEPVAGMNDPEADSLGEIYGALAAEGMAILLIEHNMRFVMSVCREIYVLDTGRLIAHGDPVSVRNNPAVIAAYLGD